MTKTRPVHCEHCDKVHGEIEGYTKLVYVATPDGSTHLVAERVLEDFKNVMVSFGFSDSINNCVVTPIKDGEKIVSGVCDKCENYLDGLEQQVTDGGVFYECNECNKKGVLPKSSYTLDLRKEVNQDTIIDGKYPLLHVVYTACSKHTVAIEVDAASTDSQSNDTLH